MKHQEYFLIALRNLRRRKLRAWLTMMGIFISIAVIFLLISLSLGLDSAVKEQFRQLGSDKFFISAKGQLGAPGSGGAVELTTKDVEVIERVTGVKDLSYWTVTSAEVRSSDQIRYVNVVGLPLDKSKVYYETGFVETTEGRVLERSDSKKAMVGSQYGTNTLFKRAFSSGDKIDINGVSFTIRGILKSVGSPPDDKIVYIPMDDFKALFPSIGDRVDQIAVQVNTGEDINEVAKKVEKKLIDSRNVTKDTEDFSIQTPEELLASFGVILNILTGFLLGVGAISLLVGGIGITNTMYTSVLERRKEIGVMKAIGARNSDILWIFTLESGLLGLVGGIIGVILGYIIGKIMELIAQNALGTNLLQTVTPFYLIAGCLLFSFLIGVVSGLVPARNASKIRPVDALRYE